MLEGMPIHCNFISKAPGLKAWNRVKGARLVALHSNEFVPVDAAQTEYLTPIKPLNAKLHHAVETV
jgi:hypothetical protein